MSVLRRSEYPHQQFTTISLDIWGTLLTSNPLYRIATFQYWRNLLGSNLTDEELKGQIKDVDTFFDDKSLITGLDYPFTVRALEIAKRVGTALSSSATEQLYHEFERLTLQHLPQIIEVDIITTLREFQARGLTLALLSNTGFIKGETMRSVLEELDLLSYFTVTLFSNEVRFAKPSVHIFNALLEATSSAATEVLHVGDHPVADYQGAVNSGISALLYTMKTVPGYHSLNQIQNLLEESK